MMLLTRRYCSIADSRYLPQLLAMYESLYKHSSRPFELGVLALDEEGENALKSLDAPGLCPFALCVFEDYLKLQPVRKSRTWQEYCWTLASQFANFLRGEREITYLDADTFFFSDPEQVFAEIGDKSIGIVPHRFPPHRKHMEANGIYNVSWATFKGPVGFQCLEKWARQTRKKCSAKEGCGDQKYLDTWPSDYPSEVCAIQNIGVGAAPWNLSQYTLEQYGGKVYLGESGQATRPALVLYHFHEYIHNKRLTNYKLREEDRKLIYAPYIAAVDKAKQQIESLMMEVK